MSGKGIMDLALDGYAMLKEVSEPWFSLVLQVKICWR